jgi:hypothetical protein
MQAIIELLAAMTVRTGTEFQGQLLAAFADNDEVILDPAAIVEVDLSFVQTVYAARDHAERQEKTIRLATPAAGPLAALLERGGFTTDADPADLHFWFHGDLPQ